jgi:hypothetical protein
LFGKKFLAGFVHSCTFKVRPVGQILLPYSCRAVNQENNFGLHQFLEEPFFSFSFFVCCYCQFMSPFASAHTPQKMWLLIQSYRDTLETNLWKLMAVKAVRDMNEVECDREKYTNPCVSGLCTSILHFV